MTADILEVASSLDHLLLPPFQRDTYPDREFSSPLRQALRHMLLTSGGLVGQDMRHLDKIWVAWYASNQEVALVASGLLVNGVNMI